MQTREENMTTTNYAPPLDKLLTLGDARPTMGRWPDYRQVGLAPEHIPDLIHMATDEELNQANSDSAEVWAPMHAWRALGQFRAASAAEPLTSLFHLIDDNDDDMVNEEMPEVLGLIGPAAIPAVTAYLADASHGLWARVVAARSLGEIGQRHPDSRAECVALLTSQLERFAEQDVTLNAFLVGPLRDLRAVESAQVMERAFAADRVEIGVHGDWEDVQIQIGLRQKRETPKPDYTASLLGPEGATRLRAALQPFSQPVSRPKKSTAKKRDKRAQQAPRGKKSRR
jgi:hypothetical protein